MTPVSLHSWEKEALGVPCPRCKAEPGGWCRSRNGLVATSLHDGRLSKVEAVQPGLFDDGLDLSQLPVPSHRNGPDTEKTATTESKVSRLRLVALRTLAQFPGGLTAGELSAETGVWLYSIAPRLTELSNTGHVEDSGERRYSDRNRPAIVWKITDRGTGYVRGL